MEYPSVTIEVWGDFALWTRPECKVERVSYPVPTPSGSRGLLSSIYSKPVEFYWQVQRIEILRPIQYATFRRNEVRTKMTRMPKAAPLKCCIYIEEDHTQRQSVVLRDVRYRITAQIVPQPGFQGKLSALLNQFERRARRGQCFMQPCMGTREFPAYFSFGSSGSPAIADSLDLGNMLYDVFDLHDNQVRQKPYPFISVFHAQMQQGVVDVPPYDSPQVLKPGKGAPHAK